MTAKGRQRSDRLLAALRGRDVVIVTHDIPDPDAIAAGWALHRLVGARGMRVESIGRGGIERAEDRLMLRLLEPPLVIRDTLPADDAAVILVDCVPTARNHLLYDTNVAPVAVVDHHEPNGQKSRVKHRDVRPAAAATDCIAATYLREQAIGPDAGLATAVLYAVHSETAGGDEGLTRTDHSVIKWLATGRQGGRRHPVGLARQLRELSHEPRSRRDIVRSLRHALDGDDCERVCRRPQHRYCRHHAQHPCREPAHDAPPPLECADSAKESSNTPRHLFPV